MNTGLILSMAVTGVITAVGKRICESLGETTMSNYIGVGGTSLVGAQAIGLVISFIHKAKQLGV
jgi:hypothetical protein